MAQTREIVREAGLDVGGVEYLERANGQRFFYDINATSVYRPDIVAATGVDAPGRLGAFIERELTKERHKRPDRRQRRFTGLRQASLNRARGVGPVAFLTK